MVPIIKYCRHYRTRAICRRTITSLCCDVFSPKSNWPFFAAISQGKLLSNLLHTIISRSLTALWLLGFLSLIEYLGFRLFFHKCRNFYFLCWISFYSPLIFPAFSESFTLFLLSYSGFSNPPSLVQFAHYIHKTFTFLFRSVKLLVNKLPLGRIISARAYNL